MFSAAAASPKHWFVYGVIFAVLALAGDAHAGKFGVLHTFTGPPNDGAYPYGALLVDEAGNLYGTTYYGGNCAVSDCGTIFKVAPNGTETILYSFQGGNDGAGPMAGLIADDNSNLYGTTSGGGSTNNGTVFELQSDGTERVLYSFQGGNDGAYPEASLIMDKAGNLYGTTTVGGGCNEAVEGCGTIFKLAPNGTETILHAFQGGSDGYQPQARLGMDKAGNLYGVTTYGGNVNCFSPYGCGTVFEISSNGTKTELYTNGAIDGFPDTGLLIDKAGNLYGTTNGGDLVDCGIVFMLTPNGTETILNYFGCADNGAYPDSDLIVDKAGNLYGTTSAGGDMGCPKQYRQGCGIVFVLSPAGVETVLYTFDRSSHGRFPVSLIKDKSTLYGIATRGGTKTCATGGCGLVFKLRL